MILPIATLACGWLLPGVQWSAVAPAARAPHRAAVRLGAAIEAFGRVVQLDDELIVIEPVYRGEVGAGARLSFPEGGSGAVLFERCGLFFGAQLEGSPVALSDEVQLVTDGNLTLTAPSVWAGAADFLGRPLDGSAEVGEEVPVFGASLPQNARKPINAPLHTGVLAIDALTPVGRGQSMLMLGPDVMPEGAGRSELVRRLVCAQGELQTGVATCLVLTADGPTSAAATEAIESGAKVLFAESAVQTLLATQSACSLAQAAGGDTMVLVDSLAPLLQLWKSSCAALDAKDIEVAAEEEGSQQRQFYSRLTERAHRRKAEGPSSLTLILVQPSASLHAAAPKAAYTLADFEEAGYSQKACARVAMLESKGIEVSEAVLEKLGIPAPGSGHPAGDGGRRAGQHVEELTSLVDGHIELRESLATAGRLPPLDPSNSLTRIGVGSSALRPASSSEAMRAVSKALRLELASAADPAGCEPAQRRRAAAYEAVLHQPQSTPMPLGEEVALLLAASSGLLDDLAEAPLAELEPVLRGLAPYVDAQDPELLQRVTQSQLLGEETAERLRGIIADYLHEQSS